MNADFAKRWFFRLLAPVAMLLFSNLASADPPIWANAQRVKATYTECGALRYVLLKGDSANVPTPPDSSGCTSSEESYRQLYVSAAFLKAENRGLISESNVDAGYIFCSKDQAILFLGYAREIESTIRQNPAPRGCTYAKEKYQRVSSVGRIAFTHVENGGTMTVAESLAMHAKERTQIIAECDASPACREERRRQSAINAYYQCLIPTEIAHTCSRPW